MKNDYTPEERIFNHARWLDDSTRGGKMVEHGDALCGTSFEGKDLTDADFSNADLSKEGGDDPDFLFNATFFEANLTRANFSNANLTGVNLTGCVVTGANFSNAIVTADCVIGVDFSDADTMGMRIINA